MHKTKYVIEKEIHKLMWDLEMLTDLLISAKRPNLVLNKITGTCH